MAILLRVQFPRESLPLPRSTTIRAIATKFLRPSSSPSTLLLPLSFSTLKVYYSCELWRRCCSRKSTVLVRWGSSRSKAIRCSSTIPRIQPVRARSLFFPFLWSYPTDPILRREFVFFPPVCSRLCKAGPYRRVRLAALTEIRVDLGPF